MSSSTTATPFLSVTPPISPTFTPATFTVCPWPGVTDCAFWNWAKIRVWLCQGKRRRSWTLT